MRLKVFARVRPPFPGEYDKGGEPCMTFGNDERTIVHADRTYDFDEVFQGDCSQDVLFERIARPTIDNAFKGFAGTVFVYGQTGTGKTHTMSNYGRRGVEVDPKEYGIIPRAVDYLFDIIHKDSGGQYTVTLQYLQLYRDNLQDLLSPDSGYLKLADAPGGGTVIQGVTTSPEVHSTEEFFEVYDEADKNRVVAETMMNKHSSRGHSVLTVFIKRAATESTEGINGKLVFVDLAGYERIKKTMIKDEVRKHEAQAINLSLGALAACIAALTAKSPHIPFRNSRLTRVLYDSLAGNSVTSVIITLGPSSLHSAESANTLYFGYNAIQCKTSVKRDLGPVDWQKEALQWKKKAVALSSQLTEMEAENKILLARLAEAGLDGEDAVAAAAAAAASGDMDDHGSLEGSRKMPTSFRTGGGSMHRRHSGMSASSGVNERLLDEVKDANAKLDEENVMRRKAEQDAEEARADVEEKAWTLEQEKSKLVYCESMNEELREQNAALGAARDDVAARLAEAERKLEQILPDETFAPTTGDDTEEALARKDSGITHAAKLEPQFIHYNPSKYEAWADLVRSEVERGTVRATEFDRAHWFVSVPDLSAFAADDRRNFEFFYRRKMAEDDRGRVAKVSRLRVRGRPLCRSTLEVEIEGDVPLEKVQQVCWQSSKDGFNFEEIAGSRGSRTVHVHPDLVHAYVRVVVAHQGVKTCSALVFINIDQVLDEQMQHLVVQGGVQFPVGLTQLTSPTNNPFAPPTSAHPPPLYPSRSPGEQPLLPPPPPPRAQPLIAPFKPGYILCIDCLGGVQIKKGGGAEGETTPPPFSGRLEELRARCEPEEARVLWVDMGLSAGVFALEANTARDRDLLLLTMRLFQALRVPGVGGALLGEFADEWLSGEWLAADSGRRRALAPRVRAVSRTGHWSALHGSPSRRAGGEATFFLRAEELTDTPLAPADAASGGAGGAGGAFDATHPQHGPAGRSSSAAAATLEPDLDLAFTRSGRVSLDLTDTMGRRLGGGSALGSPLTTSEKLKDLPLVWRNFVRTGKAHTKHAGAANHAHHFCRRHQHPPDLSHPRKNRTAPSQEPRPQQPPPRSASGRLLRCLHHRRSRQAQRHLDLPGRGTLHSLRTPLSAGEHRGRGHHLLRRRRRRRRRHRRHRRQQQQQQQQHRQRQQRRRPAHAAAAFGGGRGPGGGGRGSVQRAVDAPGPRSGRSRPPVASGRDAAQQRRRRRTAVRRGAVQEGGGLPGGERGAELRWGLCGVGGGPQDVPTADGCCCCSDGDDRPTRGRRRRRCTAGTAGGEHTCRAAVAAWLRVVAVGQSDAEAIHPRRRILQLDDDNGQALRSF